MNQEAIVADVRKPESAEMISREPGSAAADYWLRVVLEKRYDPDPRRMARYQKGYEIYTQIYPALAPLLHQMP